jgi:hypothetical protein
MGLVLSLLDAMQCNATQWDWSHRTDGNDGLELGLGIPAMKGVYFNVMIFSVCG